MSASALRMDSERPRILLSLQAGVSARLIGSGKIYLIPASVGGSWLCPDSPRTSMGKLPGFQGSANGECPLLTGVLGDSAWFSHVYTVCKMVGK